MTYGPVRDQETPDGLDIIVLPRLGTISPWSSKATDIAHNCGLAAVSRIERGVTYTLAGEPEPIREQLAPVAALLHDRMTESVVFEVDDAARLFEHHQPEALTQVDVIAGGSGALEAGQSCAGAGPVGR